MFVTVSLYVRPSPKKGKESQTCIKKVDWYASAVTKMYSESPIYSTGVAKSTGTEFQVGEV